jgi:hypothetical protein
MADSLTANIPHVRSTTPSPSQPDPQIDSRQNQRYPNQHEDWSSGLDSILNEYSNDYGPSDHSHARTHVNR